MQQTDYEEFIEQMGWYGDDSWLEYENINFTIDAPVGHLPYCGAHFWNAIPATSELPTSLYHKLERSFEEFYNNYPPSSSTLRAAYYCQRQIDIYQRKISMEQNLKQLTQNYELQRYGELDQLLNRRTPINFRPINPSVRGSEVGGGLIAALGTAAKAAKTAAPWILGSIAAVAVIGGTIIVAYIIYEKYQEEREKEEKEKEIKEKINAFLLRLEPYTM